MIRKEIKFSRKTVDAVQDYANEYCEGNFNMATRRLVSDALGLVKLIKDKRNDKNT